MRIVLVILALSVSGCSRFWRGSTSCANSPPDDARPATEEDIASLVGTFRLTQITTSFPDAPSVSELTLRTPDSATRANSSIRAPRDTPRRDLRLIGTWRRSSKHPAVSAEWDAGTLYLDCRDCFDASPDHLRIEAVSASGFWGSWENHQTGIVHVVDDGGKRLPDPAGRFCARRIVRDR